MQAQPNTSAFEASRPLRGGDNGRLLRLGDVLERIGMSRAWLYLAMSQGSFPRPVRLGRRAVAWRESDISAWQGGLPVASKE